MGRRSGVARAVDQEVVAPSHQARTQRDKFTVYTSKASGDRWRNFCLAKGIAFNELANTAIAYYLDHCQLPSRKTLALPRGRRLRRG